MNKNVLCLLIYILSLTTVECCDNSEFRKLNLGMITRAIGLKFVLLLQKQESSDQQKALLNPAKALEEVCANSVDYLISENKDQSVSNAEEKGHASINSPGKTFKTTMSHQESDLFQAKRKYTVQYILVCGTYIDKNLAKGKGYDIENLRRNFGFDKIKFMGISFINNNTFVYTVEIDKRVYLIKYTMNEEESSFLSEKTKFDQFLTTEINAEIKYENEIEEELQTPTEGGIFSKVVSNSGAASSVFMSDTSVTNYITTVFNYKCYAKGQEGKQFFVTKHSQTFHDYLANYKDTDINDDKKIEERIVYYKSLLINYQILKSENYTFCDLKPETVVINKNNKRLQFSNMESVVSGRCNVATPFFSPPETDLMNFSHQFKFFFKLRIEQATKKETAGSQPQYDHTGDIAKLTAIENFMKDFRKQVETIYPEYKNETNKIIILENAKYHDQISRIDYFLNQLKKNNWENPILLDKLINLITVLHYQIITYNSYGTYIVGIFILFSELSLINRVENTKWIPQDKPDNYLERLIKLKAYSLGIENIADVDHISHDDISVAYQDDSFFTQGISNLIDDVSQKYGAVGNLLKFAGKLVDPNLFSRFSLEEALENFEREFPSQKIQKQM